MAIPSALPVFPLELTNESAELFAQSWGLDKNDHDSIKTRVLEFQKKALQIYNYPCIHMFGFANTWFTKNKIFPEIQKGLKDVKVIDIGCMMGTDLRYLHILGAPAQNLVGVEYLQDYIDLGFQFFQDGESQMKAVFQQGSALDPPPERFLEQFDFAGLGSVFHLFDEEEINKLMNYTKSVLKKGGIMFGKTTGHPKGKEGVNTMTCNPKDPNKSVYLHSADTLSALFTSFGFTDLVVEEIVFTAEMHKGIAKLIHNAPDKPRTWITFHARKA